jgi:hypothetical protein
VLAHRSQSNFITSETFLCLCVPLPSLETHRGNNRHGRRQVETEGHAPVDHQATCRRLRCFQAPRLRDVAKCSFCGANGYEVERLIQGGGKVASGHPVMICDKCIDVCAEIVADPRAGR